MSNAKRNAASKVVTKGLGTPAGRTVSKGVATTSKGVAKTVGKPGSGSHTVVRSLHDVGLAAWFGGALMGAVGLNGASKDVVDARDRIRVPAFGWARWTPVNAAAIASHLVGGAGLLAANGRRALAQESVRGNTVAKSAVTAAALGATTYAGVLGRKIARTGHVPARSATTPSEETPEEVSEVQQRQRVVQWAVPALTGALVVLASHQGEKEKPRNVLRGTVGTARRASRRLNPAA